MKKIVVMVDDQIDLLDVYADILTEHGLSVMSFTNADDAKKYLMTTTNLEDVHAIVSDLMMGPTDGIDFLAFVKKVPELEDIDFFLVTGSAVTVFEPILRPFSIKGILQKPFSAEVLVQALLGFDYEFKKAAGL